MAKYFSSLKGLNDYIHSSTDALLFNYANIIKEKVYEQVERSYISSMGGGYYQYQPTFQLLHSITSVRRTNTRELIEYEIFFDTSKIEGVVTDTYWNSHLGMSGQSTTKKGSDIIEALPFWLEEGLSAATGTLFPREGWHVIRDIYNDYLTRFRSELIAAYKMYGITAK